MNILIVEDQYSLADAMKATLEKVPIRIKPDCKPLSSSTSICSFSYSATTFFAYGNSFVPSEVSFTPPTLRSNSVTFHSFSRSAIIRLISFLTVFIFVLFKQGLVIHIESADILPMLILGLFNTGIGCYFYFSSIGNLPVQAVAICGYLEPFSAVLFSVAFLHESMSLIQIIGAICIIGVAVCSELLVKKR